MNETPPRSKFIERLSTILVVVSSIGAILVLVDPVITFALMNGTTIHIGGNGFSDQLKGAVVSLILVSGFAAVIGYWLGASDQGMKAQESVNDIAKAAPAVAAARVAAGTGPGALPLKTDTINVDANTANITEQP